MTKKNGALTSIGPVSRNELVWEEFHSVGSNHLKAGAFHVPDVSVNFPLISLWPDFHLKGLDHRGALS